MNVKEFEAAIATGKVVDYYLDGGEYVVTAIVTRPPVYNEFGRKVRETSQGRVGFDNYASFVANQTP